MGGRGLEEAVLAEVFQVLEPAAITATIKALAEAETAEQARLAAFEAAAEKAHYEAARARRQYDACEPENRLVARSLEADWEAKLRAADQADAELAGQKARRPIPLSPDEVALLGSAGADLRAVFDAPTTTIRDRKLLLRTLISDVTVTIDPSAGLAQGVIHWEGGASSQLPAIPLRRQGQSYRVTDADTITQVRRLAEHYDDTTIAAILSRRHQRTATGLRRQPPRQPPHPLLRPNCRTRRRRCAHAHRPRGSNRTRRVHPHHLPLARRGLHHRNQTRPRRTLARPRRRHHQSENP
jgi:hypothetical protein